MYGEREFTWNKIRQQNRNPLLGDESIGADGLKTGFTKEAGYGLVGSAVQNGLRLIVVVNGLEDRQGARRRGQASCSNGASRVSKPRILFAEGQTVGEAKVYRRRARAASPVAGQGRDQADGAARRQRQASSREMVYTGPVRGAGRRRASRSAR